MLKAEHLAWLVLVMADASLYVVHVGLIQAVNSCHCVAKLRHTRCAVLGVTGQGDQHVQGNMIWLH
jgi:hypothetical protein